MVQKNAIQCGYCTPGMIMNMNGLLESKKGKVTVKEVERSLGGNICRCTGYRPILDAFKSLAVDADPKLLEDCRDIEDLNGICPKTKRQCVGSCKLDDLTKSVRIVNDEGRQWCKVYAISDIFEIFQNIGNSSYMLVGGNTAEGIYRASGIQTYIDITSIAELRTFDIQDEIVLGGNVTLTEMMQIFGKAATQNQFNYLQELNKHIELIANLAVRNTGTLAGNLMIKHKHPEFQSDIFVILETIGASIVVKSFEDEQLITSLDHFLKLDMNHKIITKIIIPPLLPQFVYRSYKIMPVAQNSPAYVNAGFMLEFNDNKTEIISARIVYGGINGKFSHAKITEAFLIGKDIFTNAILRDAVDILSLEIKPDWVLPDASPEYRKKLAISLFYKYILSIIPKNRLRPQFKSGGRILEREISSGSQIFQTTESRYPMTQALTRVDGYVQAGGETQYANDYPKLMGELWGAFVHASKVHAVISGFNATTALKIPGVVAFYSAKDIPGLNSFVSKEYPGIEELEEVFCSGKVIYSGQPAGMILATNRSIAIKASYMVQVLYEKKVTEKSLPTNAHVFEANATDRIHRRPEFDHKAIEYGTDTTKSIKGSFEMGTQYAFYMEPQTCIAIPLEDGLKIIASTQWMSHCQVAISKLLKLQESQIDFEVRRLGGGFGGKQSRSILVACAAALGAFKTNRPVRFIMTMPSTMSALGKRHPCSANYEVDINDDGKIQKLHQTYYTDHGNTFNDLIEILVTNFFINCYDPKPFDIISNAVKTNAPSHSYLRAPGILEGMGMIENIMEHIAYETGKDSIEVRMQNVPEDNPIRKMLPDFIVSTDYYKRKAVVDEFNLKNRWTKKGIAIMPIQYRQNFFGHFPALVTIHHNDGTVVISHGGIEMGQGVTTKAVQVAASILGVNVNKIRVKPTNNLISPNTAVSGGSIVSDSVCLVIRFIFYLYLIEVSKVKIISGCEKIV